MNFDIHKLLTLPGITREECDRLGEGILALATDIKPEAEAITIESLWKIYTEAKVIPMTFKPTGECVYVTPQFADWIDRFRKTGTWKHEQF